MSALLEVQGLSKSFPIEGGVFRRRLGSVQALNNVSFQLEPGETLAVVGGSGCGKSTLARLIAGLLVPDAGTMLWKGKPLDGFSARERAHKIQMIFQDPYASLNPKLSIGTQLSEASGSGDLGALLNSVGLPADAVSHYPFQFSGGQRQRIAIARSLALRPELLIADEPLSALDVSIQAQIIGLFRELRKTLGLTLLLITHDLAVASLVADRILVLQNGEVVEAGPARETLSAPRDAYTKALLQAVPQLPC